MTQDGVRTTRELATEARLSVRPDEDRSRFALGLLSRAAISSPVTTLGSGSEDDVTGLSVTADVGVGRAVSVSAKVRLTVADSGARVVVRLYEDAALIGAVGDVESHSAGERFICSGEEMSLSPSLGVHTYKVTVEVVAGTGSVDVDASATNQSWIKVTDEGADSS